MNKKIPIFSTKYNEVYGILGGYLIALEQSSNNKQSISDMTWLFISCEMLTHVLLQLCILCRLHSHSL